jgi:hypothetical protein
MSDDMVRKWVRRLTKIVIKRMGSRRATGRLRLEAVTFYEKSIQKLVPLYNKCLNNGKNYVESCLRYGESDKNNTFWKIYFSCLIVQRYLLSEYDS